MSKDKQHDSQEENNEPLLSIVTTSPIKAKESAFNTVLENKPVAPPPVQATAQVNEIVHEQPIVVKSLKPEPVKSNKKIVYEFTYIDEHQIEVTIYSYRAPIYASSTQLSVTEFFGKELLHENVLGMSEVKSSCKIEYEQDEVLIDLAKGVVIKSIEEESWMSLDYEATKKIFDEAVLRAYRSASQVQPAAMVNKRKPAANTQVNSDLEDPSIYREGNIPVNRGPLIKDF